MRKIFGLFLIMVFCILLTDNVHAIEVKRISGEDRYETAVMGSKEYFSKNDYAIVASGEKYPDAVIGGSLSSTLKCPVFLTKMNSINESALNEMKRLGVQKVFLLGGRNSISDSVITQINKKGISVERISGKDRFETAKNIERVRNKFVTQKIGALTSLKKWNIYGVNANNFYDALYTAPYVGNTYSNIEGYAYSNFIEYCHPTFSYEKDDVGTVVGDVKVVVNDPYDFRPIQLGSNNRFKSSVEIAKEYVNSNNRKGKETDTVILVSGEKYPDGLSASGISGLFNAPVLLTSNARLDETVNRFIKDFSIKKVIIIGGENTISKQVVQDVYNPIENRHGNYLIIPDSYSKVKIELLKEVVAILITARETFHYRQ